MIFSKLVGDLHCLSAKNIVISISKYSTENASLSLNNIKIKTNSNFISICISSSIESQIRHQSEFNGLHMQIAQTKQSLRRGSGFLLHGFLWRVKPLTSGQDKTNPF